MKHFKLTAFSSENYVASGEIDADHFSINSNTGGAQFYRFGNANNPNGTVKDELVGSAPGGVFVSVDEKTTVLDATLADLSDPVLDKLAEALDVDELNDEQKIRIAVTWAE